jgi:hypothetical protein
MEQTYEYYTVDPKTWRDVARLRNVTGSTLERDSDAESLGSASISMTELIGECYVRVYLVTVQNGIRERTVLGTYLLQSPSSDFDGKIREITADGYTPLIELKDNLPPLGYSALKGDNVMDIVYRTTQENVRAPVVKAVSDTILFDDFVANADDTWLSFNTDLMTNAKYKYSLDEMGRILFAPDQDTSSLQPVWTYTDDNSSILLPSLTMEHDLFGIPNVVEVVYSSDTRKMRAKAVNDDPNSPISTVNRGRVVKRRITDPSLFGSPTQLQIDEYAERLLRELSSVEYTITYTHGYCPVRLGDCVRLDYAKAGLTNIKAKVIRQSISCVSGCTVSETAVFNTKLWR